MLHDISIYRPDIECEPKTDYEQCLNQHRIKAKIDIEWRNHLSIGLIFKILNNILMKFMQKCSFCQFWGIFGGIVQKSNLKEQILNRTLKAEIVQHYSIGDRDNRLLNNWRNSNQANYYLSHCHWFVVGNQLRLGFYSLVLVDMLRASQQFSAVLYMA